MPGLRRLFIMSFTGLLLAASSAFAEAEQAGQAYDERLDLAYYEGPDADEERHRLNLVLPEGRKPIATLLWGPGGAWAFGSREREMPVARAFARAGVAVAVVDHRMSAGRWMSEEWPDTGAVHPDHIEDFARAFAWLHAHAEKYGLDRERFFVGGFSAGGHLAALLATDPHYLAAHDLGPESIAGAVPVGGAYDLEQYYEAIRGGLGEDVATGHVLGAFGPREKLRAASPTSYLEQASTPMLVIAEGETEIYAVPFREAVEKAEKSDLIRFKTFEDETHASLFKNLGDSDAPSPAREMIIEFLKTGAHD